MTEKNCRECLHFNACSKWTDFPKQCGFPVCAHFEGWISVEERLPDRSGTYLVIGKNGTPHTAHFYADAPKFSNRYVRFWMPLPEAPVEVEK